MLHLEVLLHGRIVIVGSFCVETVFFAATALRRNTPHLREGKANKNKSKRTLLLRTFCFPP